MHLFKSKIIQSSDNNSRVGLTSIAEIHENPDGIISCSTPRFALVVIAPSLYNLGSLFSD
jgi:hypothetical protein